MPARPSVIRGAKGSVARACLLGLFATGALVAMPHRAEAQSQTNYNLYGVPGLIDMPSAGVAPDSEIGTTISRFGNNTRTTLTFQITPRLSGSFRYSAIDNFDTVASVDGVYYDRSFDMRFQLLTEGLYRPSLVVGFQDFIGTGLYGGEYLVATKTVAPGLTVTGGLGWGRLASRNAFASTGTRPEELLGEGGLPTYDRWFRGDVAAFGGVSYSPNDRWTFKAEYASDNYDQERRIGEFDGTSPWNFGLDYHFENGSQLSLYSVYGTEVGAQLTLVLNPRKAAVPGGLDPAPLPVDVRPRGSAADLGWTTDPTAVPSSKVALSEALEQEGLKLEGLELTAQRATLRLKNNRYYAVSQAVGRAARAMTRNLPASVEEFVIVPTENGMALSAVTMRRSDLEALENEAATEMFARTRFTDGIAAVPPVEPGLYPDFTWSLSPYVALSVFDPDNPLRADGGLRLRGNLRLSPGIIVSGSVTKKLTGNLDSVEREDESSLPLVRTQYAEFSRQGDPAIEHLTLAAYGRPAKDFYSRLTVGYLEKMYAGASAELLWKPVNSRLALGAELNYVQLRDYDQLFGVQSMVTTDPVSGVQREIPNLNGHLSAYYDFGNGFHGQLDVGRYLAGDYGATITVDREFANGWKVGAYATVTDVPFEDFGEGSFDKGIRVSVPLGWALGTATKRVNSVSIKSLTRDGGARLDVDGRLYDQVRNSHRPEMAKTWGRFWR